MHPAPLGECGSPGLLSKDWINHVVGLLLLLKSTLLSSILWGKLGFQPAKREAPHRPEDQFTPPRPPGTPKSTKSRPMFKVNSKLEQWLIQLFNFGHAMRLAFGAAQSWLGDTYTPNERTILCLRGGSMGESGTPGSGFQGLQ